MHPVLNRELAPGDEKVILERLADDQVSVFAALERLQVDLGRRTAFLVVHGARRALIALLATHRHGEQQDRRQQQVFQLETRKRY